MREAKRDGVLVGDPPVRAVTRVTDLIGPRGGVVYVLGLACGHWVSRRKLPTKTEVPCIGCLIEKAIREKDRG